MEKYFHLNLSTDMKLIRRTFRTAACDRKRNAFVLTSSYTVVEARLGGCHIAQDT